MADLKFDRTFVLTLARRADRLREFFNRVNAIADWPFDVPQVRYGADGSKLIVPHWCGENMSAGSWGCTMSYARLIEDALSNGWDSVMVFEDDACFRTKRQVPGTETWEPADFGEDVRTMMAAVPDDWDAIYFGCNLRTGRQKPPMAVNDLVMRPHRVTATHGFAMRKRFMERAYKQMFRFPMNICDWRFSDVHCGVRHDENNVYSEEWPRPQVNVYAAIDRLVGQGPNKSDISHMDAYEKDHPDGYQFWPNPTTITYLPDFLHPPEPGTCRWLKDEAVLA